ncbi:MAG: hypothetical protein J5449_13350, partial [Oscillospiraceae bacterium]|nr:hypothetical protein [Oscillospiraceae bacterium]
VTGNTHSAAALTLELENDHEMEKALEMAAELAESGSDADESELMAVGESAYFTFAELPDDLIPGNVVVLAGLNVIFVAGELSGAVGLTALGADEMDGAFVVAAPFSSQYTITSEDAACLFSDNEEYGVNLVDDEGTALCILREAMLSLEVTGVSGTTLTYSLADAPANALLVAASYNKDGKLLGVTTADAKQGTTLNGTIKVISGAVTYKLMLVDKDSYAPLCENDVWPHPVIK